MIELKVHCDCGQKYKFDVEPVNGQMPFTVACPICKRDGTAKANGLLETMRLFKPADAPTVPAAAAPPPVAAPVRISLSSAPAPSAPPPPPIGSAAQASPGIRIAATTSHPAGNAGSSPPPLPATQSVGRQMPKREGAESRGEVNLGMGIVGVFLGAALGVGLVYGFFEIAGFRFPLLGVAIGVLTGLGSKLMYKGTSNAMGIISGGVSLVAVVGALFLMYGSFPLLSIISVVVSVSMAYRIAGGG